MEVDEDDEEVDEDVELERKESTKATFVSQTTHKQQCELLLGPDLKLLQYICLRAFC